MLARVSSLVKSSWSQENSKRSCCLILWGQILALVTLLAIGFVYVHVYLPNYNAKRLSKHPLVCATVENEWMDKELCELPWDKSHITLGRADHTHRLFEGDSHSAIVAPKKEALVRSEENTTNGNEERHFTWSSCGEFCSSSLVERYGCRQLRVNARQQGSQLVLEGCTNLDVKECPFLDFDDGTENDDRGEDVCSTGDSRGCLHKGIFKCVVPTKNDPMTTSTTGPPSVETTNTTLGQLDGDAANDTISAPINSTTTPSPATTFPTLQKAGLKCTHIEHLVSCNTLKLDKDGGYSLKIFNCTSPSSPQCFNSPGTYVCDSESWCRKIPKPANFCTRICHNIGLDDKNVVISDELFGHVITAKCDKGYRDRGKKMEVWPRGVRHLTDDKWKYTPPILITCRDIHHLQGLKSKNASIDKIDIQLGDCFNGTRLENVTLPPSSTLKELQALWFRNLANEDYELDPIEQKDAPTLENLTLHKFSPLYLNDFYKNQGEGCVSVISDEKFVTDKCTSFYVKYGRLSSDPRGQSVFPCYCRNVSSKELNSTFCVVGNMPGVNVFERYWEDNVMDFLETNCDIVLVFLSMILICSLIMICVLLYPLLMDWTPVNNLVLVGVAPSANVRQSPTNVEFVEDKRSEAIFTISGSGSGSSRAARRDAMQMEGRKSRRSSVVSYM